MSSETTPSSTVTRKPDDDVGKRGAEPAGGGHQTAEQAAITGIGQGGRTDHDRSHDAQVSDRGAGRNPAPIGGSSGGHSDQLSASKDGKVADGHYDIEKGNKR